MTAYYRHDGDQFALHQEIARLRLLLHRDRTGLARALDHIRATIQGASWLGRPGEWGSYEYHQRTMKTLRLEIAMLLDEVDHFAEWALRLSGSRVTEGYHPHVPVANPTLPPTSPPPSRPARDPIDPLYSLYGGEG